MTSSTERVTQAAPVTAVRYGTAATLRTALSISRQLRPIEALEDAEKSHLKLTTSID